VGKKRCMAECEQTGEGREEWTVSPPYVPLLLCRQGSNLPCARPPAVNAFDGGLVQPPTIGLDQLVWMTKQLVWDLN